MTALSSTMANLIAKISSPDSLGADLALPSTDPDGPKTISVKNSELIINPNLNNKLMNRLNEWSATKTGFHLNLENQDMFSVLVLQLGNKDKTVRTEATNFLSACLKNSPQNPPPSAIFDDSTLNDLRTVTIPILWKEIQTPADVGNLEQFILLVKLLGVHLHSGAGLINTVMKIVERAFKSPKDDTMMEAAFRAWSVLMDNFALNQQILKNPKRFKLLMAPLQVKNNESIVISRAKFEAWWHLIVLLGENCKDHLEIAVLEFFKFAYGDRLDHVVVANPVESPSSPMWPIKNNSGLDLLCLDALVQLLAGRPLDPSLPKTQLKDSLDKSVLTLRFFRNNASQVMFALQEATVIVKPVNRSEVLRLEAIWSQIGKVFGLLAERCQEDDCGKEEADKTVEAVYWYVKRVKHVVVQCRRQEKLHKLIIKILESASRLSSKALNTTYVSKNDSESKSTQKPVMHLLQVILHQDLLPLASQVQELQYLQIVRRLLHESLKSPNGHSILPFVHARMEEMARAVTLTGSNLDGLALVWQVIAELTANMDNLEPSFGTLLSLLAFPVAHCSDKGADSKVWKVWSILYQAAVSAGEVSVMKDTSYICHELTLLLVAVAKSQETKDGILAASSGVNLTGKLADQARFAKAAVEAGSGVCLPTGQLAAQARCANVMVAKVDLPSLARLINSRDPLPNFAPRVSSGSVGPLGNLTGLVTHINSLFNYINTTSTWSYSRGNSVGSALKSVLSSYQHLITSINQQELIRPLLKIVTPTIAKMLNDKFLKTMSKHLPNLAEEVEKVFTATVLMIQARYSGTYTKDFLSDLEEFLIAAFGYGKKLIKTKTNEMWQVTFGLLPKSDVSPALASALRKCSNPSLRAQWSQEEVVVSFPSSTDSQSGSASQLLVITAEPAIANAINRSENKATKSHVAVIFDTRKMTPKKDPPPPESTAKPETPSEMKPPANKPQIKKRSPRLLEDDSSQDFVAINSCVPKKRVLTDHQKDVMTARHDDIPALYSELSRDDSIIHLPAQFMSQHSIDESQPSTDLWDKIKEVNKQSKENDIIDESDKNGKEEDVNGPIEGGSQSLLDIEKKAAMKELKNKRFELRLEETPKADKIAKEETKKLRSKRKAEESSEGDGKRTKLDFGESTTEMNGQSKTKAEIADDLFKSSQNDPTDAPEINEPDSVEIVSPEPKPAPETVSLTSSDENSENTIKPAEKDSTVKIDVQKLSTENVNVQELDLKEKDLSRVDVKVQKLSPVVIKKHTEHEKGVSAPIKKKLFGEVPAESKDDSSEDDIIQSSQPQKEELEQTRSKRGRRSLSKLEMEVKQMPQKKLSRGKKESKSDSKEVEKRNAFGETSLHATAKKGDVVKVEEQLKAGADPNVKDNAGWYPLHEVSISDKENSLGIMNLLIKHGAMVDCQNKEGVTPLQEAVENATDNGGFEKVEILMSAGANPDLKTANGKNAFDFAEGDENLINILNKEKKDMNVTPVRSSSREKKRSVRLTNFVDMESENGGKEELNGEKVQSETVDKSALENAEKDDVENSSKISVINESMEVDENPNVSEKQNGTEEEDSKKNGVSSETSEEVTNNSKEICAGSASPDANKENMSSNGDDDHANSGKTPLASQNGLVNIAGEEKKDKVNPFTAVIEKHKAETKKRTSLGSAGTSRGAMLLSLSRRSSMDPTTRPSAAALALLDPIQGSPVSTFSSPKPDISKSMPWVKYKPSPSSASPSASILKRKGLDSEGSSNCEDSPISTKNPRLDTSLNGRRVHFNEDPVSDSVEIPRVPDGKHTRKKLQLSGFEQEMFVDNKTDAEAEQESQASLGLYSDSPPVDLTASAIYPDLANSKEPIALIVPHLATGNWAKILATDLKNNGITQVGQLAVMDPCQIRTLRGVKPNKVDSVKNTLKTLHKKLLKEGKMVDEKKEKAKAPVEEVTTPEDEEKIKEDLFHRPSPSPTDLGFSPLDAIPTSPDRNNVEMEDVEIKKEILEKPFSDSPPPKLSPSNSPMKVFPTRSTSPTKASKLDSPISSPVPSPSKVSPIASPVPSLVTSPSRPITSPLLSPSKVSPITSPIASPSKASPTTSPVPSPTKASPVLPQSREASSSPELKSMTVRIPRMKTIKDVSQDIGSELENVFETPDTTDQTATVSKNENCFNDLDFTEELLNKMSNEELMENMDKTRKANEELMENMDKTRKAMMKIFQIQEKIHNKLKSNMQ